MGTFKSNKTFFAAPALIPAIARDIVADFTNDGYEVQSQELMSGGYDISITKGGMFKAVIGMKTALKVNIRPNGSDGIQIEAGVGIFGQQAIPTVISMLFFWPVLITQISGMISQAKMDDRVMVIAADTIARAAFSQQAPASSGQPTAGRKFCTRCGKSNEADAAFCSGCGNKL